MEGGTKAKRQKAKERKLGTRKQGVTCWLQQHPIARHTTRHHKTNFLLSYNLGWVVGWVFFCPGVFLVKIVFWECFRFVHGCGRKGDHMFWVEVICLFGLVLAFTCGICKIGWVGGFGREWEWGERWDRVWESMGSGVSFFSLSLTHTTTDVDVLHGEKKEGKQRLLNRKRALIHYVAR